MDGQNPCSLPERDVLLDKLWEATYQHATRQGEPESDATSGYTVLSTNDRAYVDFNLALIEQSYETVVRKMEAVPPQKV